jgi:hypothetical protein
MRGNRGSHDEPPGPCAIPSASQTSRSRTPAPFRIEERRL